MLFAGAIYEQKLKHCNNLLHWLPFEMMNDDKDVTAFYPRDNLQLRQYACNGGHHCLEKAPLFSILSKYFFHSHALLIIWLYKYIFCNLCNIYHVSLDMDPSFFFNFYYKLS